MKAFLVLFALVFAPSLPISAQDSWEETANEINACLEEIEPEDRLDQLETEVDNLIFFAQDEEHTAFRHADLSRESEVATLEGYSPFEWLDFLSHLDAGYRTSAGEALAKHWAKSDRKLLAYSLDIKNSSQASTQFLSPSKPRKDRKEINMKYDWVFDPQGLVDDLTNPNPTSGYSLHMDPDLSSAIQDFSASLVESDESLNDYFGVVLGRTIFLDRSYVETGRVAVFQVAPDQIEINREVRRSTENDGYHMLGDRSVVFFKKEGFRLGDRKKPRSSVTIHLSE